MDIRFSDREAHDGVEYRPFLNAQYSITRQEKDVGIQAVPATVTRGVQVWMVLGRGVCEGVCGHRRGHRCGRRFCLLMLLRGACHAFYVDQKE